MHLLGDRATRFVLRTGLFKVSEGHLQPFECEASVFATTNFAKGIRECPDGTFALAGEKGLAFFDRDGHVVDYILVSENDELGIGRNAPFIDHEEQLWIPTHGLGAVIQIDLRSAVRRWKSKVISPSWPSNATQTIGLAALGWCGTFPIPIGRQLRSISKSPRSQDAIFIDDEIVFTTTSGIWAAPVSFPTEANSPEQEAHEPISESNPQSLSSPARTIVGAGSATAVEHLPGTNSVLIATIDSGIRWYQRSQGEWMLRGTLPGISSECLDTKYDPAQRRLWFSSRSEQGRWFAGRLNLDPANPLDVSNLQLYEDQVSDTNYCFAIWNGRVLFNSRDGLKWYNESAGRFEDLDLPLPSPDKQGIINAIEVDSKQQLWVHVIGEGLYRIDRDGVADLAYRAIDVVSRIQANPESNCIHLISTSSDLYQIPIQRNRVERRLPEINSIRRLVNNRSNRNLQNGTRESNVYSIAYAAQSANLHPFAKYQFRLLNLSDEWSLVQRKPADLSWLGTRQL